MRTSSQKQKPIQQARTDDSTMSGRLYSSQGQAEHSILHLQRLLGNQAVQRMLLADVKKHEADQAGSAPAGSAHDSSRMPILSTSPVQVQPKLPVSKPGDMYEEEADHVANQVMRMPEAQLQRACSCGGGCPRCSNEQGGPERLQTKSVEANDAGEVTMPPLAHELVSSPGQPLEPVTRGFMEARFGYDFSQVRVHTGPPAADAARAVQARAFTLGRDIVFDTGEYAPHGTSGQKLLAHELTHVIQQRSGGYITAAHLGGALAVHQRAHALSVQRQKAKPAEAPAVDPAFWEWWKKVVGFEGSLEAWAANPANKNDKGGKTNWGVTKKIYMLRAKALGLPATDEGFAAMTPGQAMRFGQMMWKASGANKIKNTGVALVLADWYWGGIDLGLLKNLLKQKGHKATFNMGTPSDATLNFMNTLSPSELVELMSAAKETQYRAFVKADPTQKEFLEGWLKRNEERRQQAQPFLPPPPPPQPAAKAQPRLSIWEHAQRALGQAREVMESGAASDEDKQAAKAELWAVLGRIDEKQIAGFAHAEEEMSLKNLKRELFKELDRINAASNR